MISQHPPVSSVHAFINLTSLSTRVMHVLGCGTFFDLRFRILPACMPFCASLLSESEQERVSVGAGNLRGSRRRPSEGLHLLWRGCAWQRRQWKLPSSRYRPPAKWQAPLGSSSRKPSRLTGAHIANATMCVYMPCTALSFDILCLAITENELPCHRAGSWSGDCPDDQLM